MKRFTAGILSLLLVLSITACSQQSAAPDAGEPAQPEVSVSVENPETAPDIAEPSAPEKAPKILIAYFTYGENAELPSDVDASASASIQILNGEITGNTGLMAHMIAEASGGELFSIRTVTPYPGTYNETIDVGSAEKERGDRPALSTHIENLEEYDTVFVGFPNWWYGMPMVMYSFFDEYDFEGKTIIPFCTSGGSAFSGAIEEIRNLEPDATVLDGLHIGASSVSNARDTVVEWVKGLGLNET